MNKKNDKTEEKVRKIIIIISVEGNESYTEVKFFEGIVNHKQDLNLKIFALLKSAHKKTDEKNKTKTANILVPIFEKYNNISIFFIGDGDKEADIPSMKQTQMKTIEIIEELKEQKHSIEIIPDLFPKNMKFEQEINYFPHVKSISNFNSFNNFAKEKKLFNENKLDWEKVLEYFENTIYINIFKKIIEQ